jgi:2-succinyl-5-enolpyruvyl-6-hydroxy-3-cyclohexene-1-carboxylate synthase
MEAKHYTDERNVQIMISLLKQHGIHRVIASPGTTNMTFVGSIQNDPYFQVWSSVDERSAAYLACGMASETGEPVVLSCTGATASRNYMPGLTEAYYRKLPVLAITSHRGDHQIGHLCDQQVDRRNIPNDIAVMSVTLPMVNTPSDEKYCVDNANKAILALGSNGGGPVHVNMFTAYSKNFTVKSFAPARKMTRVTSHNSAWPELPDGRIAIFVGSHQPFSAKTSEAIDRFCAIHDAVVFTSHISGYHGKYKVNYSIASGQRYFPSECKNIDLLIHVGEISGNTYIVHGKQTWRVSDDGQVRDTFNNMTYLFDMPEEKFFEHYAIGDGNHTEYLDACKEDIRQLYDMIPELPFGNIWVAQHTISHLSASCEFHMGILNSLRSWNFFQLPEGVSARSNVGGYGIDGGISTMIGASLVNREKLFVGVFGDLAFFYDMNVLGNREVGNNVRIMLINNGMGAEFRNYDHPCYPYGEDAEKFMAAAGHYGNKSPKLVKHYAEDLGYEYLSASDKESFLNAMPQFVDDKLHEKPMVFEVFTDRKNESDALETILNLVKPDYHETIKNRAKRIASSLIGETGTQAIKKIISKI